MIMEDDLKRIYLLRHCKTSYNLEGKISGAEDIPIQENSICIPDNIRLNYYMIITSPLERCLQTVHLFEDINLILPAELIKNDLLIERGMGDITGQDKKTVVKKYSELFDYNGRFKLTMTPPNGEPYQIFYNRIQKFKEYLLNNMKRFDGDIVICSHNQAIKMLCLLLLELNPETLWGSLDFQNGHLIPLVSMKSMS